MKSGHEKISFQWSVGENQRGDKIVIDHCWFVDVLLRSNVTMTKKHALKSRINTIDALMGCVLV